MHSRLSLFNDFKMIDCKKKTLLLKVINGIYYSGAFNINTFRPQWGIWYCRSCNINWLPGAQGEYQTCGALLAQLLRCPSNLLVHCKRFISLFARHNLWSPPGFSFRPCIFVYKYICCSLLTTGQGEDKSNTPLGMTLSAFPDDHCWLHIKGGWAGAQRGYHDLVDKYE